MILLGDTFLANSSEPWRIPDTADLPDIDPHFAEGPNAGDEFLPYLRDEHGARPWAIPGTPGLQHRIGGLEKENGSGNISYDPANHALMTRLRAEKLEKLAEEMPDLEVDADEGAELLVLGWGSTYGVVRGRGAADARAGHPDRDRPPAPPRPAAPQHRRRRAAFPKVLIPEMNTGQLLSIIRAQVPRRRGRLQQNGGPADPRRGDGSRDPGGPVDERQQRKRQRSRRACQC